MQEFHVILNYDVVFFSSSKALLELCFWFEWYPYMIRFILSVAGFVTLMYQTLYMILFDLCVCEWVQGVEFWMWLFSDARTSLPSSSVYHIGAWICCFDCHHLPPISASFMLLFCSRSGSSFWSVGCDLTWSGSEDVNEACDVIAKPPPFLSFTCINLLLIPPFVCCCFQLKWELHLYNCKMP